MINFALIGASGYIAPRHMNAIKETGNNLLAALDKHDSVGVIDSYFPKADFFTEFERFDRHIEKLKREQSRKVDYVSIASPNYLHDSHIRFALRSDANAICEKPLVLNPWNAEALLDIENESNRKIYSILQLRHHPAILKLRESVKANQKQFDVDLTYITSRGNWYLNSWKGNHDKAGGIATNIGIHFFDMLIWVFGSVEDSKVFLREKDKSSGLLKLKTATVRWFLSIDENDLPSHIKSTNQRTYRSILLDDAEIEFSSGFTDLHTTSYNEILNQRGFGVEATIPSIHLAHQIRNNQLSSKKGFEFHPFLEGEHISSQTTVNDYQDLA